MNLLDDVMRVQALKAMKKAEWAEEPPSARSIFQDAAARAVVVKVLKSRSVRHYIRDVQILDEPQAPRSATFDSNAEIKDAYEKLDPQAALRKICDIWTKLDESVQLAEARTRILLAKLPPPELAAMPNWLDEQLPAMMNGDDDTGPPNRAAVESSIRLIRACVHHAPSLGASVTNAPLGRVSVDWDLPTGKIRWLVGTADLPWPGASVISLVKTRTDSGVRRSTAIFHTAFDVVAQFREAL